MYTVVFMERAAQNYDLANEQSIVGVGKPTFHFRDYKHAESVKNITVLEGYF